MSASTSMSDFRAEREAWHAGVRDHECCAMYPQPSNHAEYEHGPGSCKFVDAPDVSTDVPHCSGMCAPLEDDGTVIMCFCGAPSGWSMPGYCDSDS